MKKFTFRLQAVLDMRKNELEKKQQEMASINQILNKQISELEYIHAQRNQVLASITDIETGQMLDINMISNNQSYLAKLDNDAVNQTKVIENTKRVIAQKQAELNEIYKKVKTLEKLKENQEKEYYQEIEKKLNKEIDDIVTARYKVS